MGNEAILYGPYVQATVFEYLVELRDSGELNMWGAATSVQSEFELDADTAAQAWQDWKDSL